MASWYDVVSRGLVTMACHPVVLVFVGGGCGSVARYLAGAWIGEQAWAKGLPWGTFAINVSGSFLLALGAVGILHRLPAEYAPLFLLLGTGFCGGFTTFSTFEWEAYALWRDGHALWAVGYLFGSVVAGMAGVVLAVALTRFV